MNDKITPNSFVALSDFHAFEWPLEKVMDYYLNEYTKVYILGDATDRGKDNMGTGGVDLLLKIKELSEKYPNRVVYIPGNHDSFLYDYAAHKEESAIGNMIYNGGSQTLQDIDALKEKAPAKFNSLVTWLGNQPLQRMHEFNGKKYALAHAFFNQVLYEQLPNFSLKDLHDVKDNKNAYNYAKTVLWFRKGQDEYSPSTVPEHGVIEVIGHTPEKYRTGMNLDLQNKLGEVIKVQCVDGGIAYNGEMLKYDGGKEPISTVRGRHQNTAPKSPAAPVFSYGNEEEMKKVVADAIKESQSSKYSNNGTNQRYDENLFIAKTYHFSPSSETPKQADLSIDSLLEKEKLLKKIIVNTMQRSKSKEQAYSTLQNLYLNGDTHEIPAELKEEYNKGMSYDSIMAIIQMYKYNRDGANGPFQDVTTLYENYIDEVCFDHIAASLKTKFGSQYNVINQLAAFFKSEDYVYITESVGAARSMSRKIGIPALKQVIRNNHCTRISQYINKKFADENMNGKTNK